MWERAQVSDAKDLAPILVHQLPGHDLPFPSLSYLICKMEDTIDCCKDYVS